MNNKVVLAFSGGLDTSFCVPYLKEKGYEVHTIMVNTGGFSAEEEKAIENRALTLGAASHVNVNAVEEYEETKKRYEFLIGQKEDIENAAGFAKKEARDLFCRTKEAWKRIREWIRNLNHLEKEKTGLNTGIRLQYF